MRPRQTHRIPPLLLGKLEAYSVLHTTYLPVHTSLDNDKIINWCALSNANQFMNNIITNWCALNNAHQFMNPIIINWCALISAYQFMNTLAVQSPIEFFFLKKVLLISLAVQAIQF